MVNDACRIVVGANAVAEERSDNNAQRIKNKVADGIVYCCCEIIDLLMCCECKQRSKSSVLRAMEVMSESRGANTQAHLADWFATKSSESNEHIEKNPEKVE